MPEAPYVDERYTSREFHYTRNELTVTRHYVVFNTDNPIIASQLLPSIGDQFDIDGELLPAWVNDVSIKPTEAQKPVYMDATVTYGKYPTGGDDPKEKQQPEENVATWSLSISTESINVQKAIKQINAPADKDKDAPYLAINEDNEGVKGVDILTSSSTLKIVHWLSQDVADGVFLDGVDELTAKVNLKPLAGPWGTWATGEALYLGAEVSTVNGTLIQLSHTFKRSRNGWVDMPYVDGGDRKKVQGVLKDGWQYLWNKFRPVKNKDDARAQTVNDVVSSHLATVYDKVDFKALKLPKTFVGAEEDQ